MPAIRAKRFGSRILLKKTKEKAMGHYLVGKFIRLRCRKVYPDAHTHLVVGKVIEETSRYLVVDGRTFHYRKIVDRKLSQFNRGAERIRVVPWENIEIIHELGENVDLNADFVFDLDGNLVFMDRDKTMIVGNGDAEA